MPPLGTQTTTTYHGDVQNVAPGCVPRIYNHSYTISADLHIPDGGAEGVIVADANHLGGFSLFVADGKLKHTYAFLGVFEYHQESDGELPTGDVNVQMSFVADEAKPATPGQVTLYVNGKPVGSGRLDHTVPFGFSGYRAWTSAGITAWSSTAATPARRRSRSPARSRRWSSTWPRTPAARTRMPCTRTRIRHTPPAASTPRTSTKP